MTLRFKYHIRSRVSGDIIRKEKYTDQCYAFYCLLRALSPSISRCHGDSMTHSGHDAKSHLIITGDSATLPRNREQTIALCALGGCSRLARVMSETEAIDQLVFLSSSPHSHDVFPCPFISTCNLYSLYRNVLLWCSLARVPSIFPAVRATASSWLQPFKAQCHKMS